MLQQPVSVGGWTEALTLPISRYCGHKIGALGCIWMVTKVTWRRLPSRGKKLLKTYYWVKLTKTFNFWLVTNMSYVPEKLQFDLFPGDVWRWIFLWVYSAVTTNRLIPFVLHCPAPPHLQGLYCSLPCEHFWGSPTRRNTSPPHSSSLSRSGTAQRPPVPCSTGLAETSFCHQWRCLWLAAAGQQSEPPVRRWADAIAPHKSLNDAWVVLKVSHTRGSVQWSRRPQPQNERRR